MYSVGDKVKIKPIEEVRKLCRLWQDRPQNQINKMKYANTEMTIREICTVPIWGSVMPVYLMEEDNGKTYWENDFIIN